MCRTQWHTDNKKDTYWKCPIGTSLQKCFSSVTLWNVYFLMAHGQGSPLSDKNGETFASWCTNMQLVSHRKLGLFNVTTIPLRARREQLSGAGNGKRFGAGGPVGLRKLHAVRCVSGHQRQSNDYTQWVEQSAADTNAVQGETRDRALVTTVRGHHFSNRQHYGYQIEQICEFFSMHWWYFKKTMLIYTVILHKIVMYKWECLTLEVI